MAKEGYKANIAVVVEEIEAEYKRSGAFLAKISGDLRKKEVKGVSQ